MTASAIMVDQAASLVRRSRAGDENAMAMLVKIGQAARQGSSPRAQSAFTAIKQYIERNPAQPFTLGADTVAVADAPLMPSASSPSTSRALGRPLKVDPEKKKPPLPRGIFDRLFNPDDFALVVIRACQFRNGLPAAAVVLASGPPLTNAAIRQIGESNFGSDTSTGTFYHGVKNPTDDDWAGVAPYLDPPLRRCLAIGQCVGRARRIQAVRQRGSSITAYSECVGWELGE
jgi:hypothetical protein